MSIAVYASKKTRDLALAEAVLACFDGDGKIFTDGRARLDDGFDLHSINGLKHASIMRELEAANAKYLYWDKALFRDRWPEWWRVTYRSQQPGDFIGALNFPHTRAAKQGWFDRMKPWRRSGKHVLICGWSGKCSAFLGIPDPTTTIRGWIKELQNLTNRPLVYRSKPSWPGAEPIPGAGYSAAGRRTIQADLRDAHTLVTYSSGTCWDALLEGVPSILLGPGICRPISSTSLGDIENPLLADDVPRRQIVANAACLQWSLAELHAGVARPALEEIMATADVVMKGEER